MSKCAIYISMGQSESQTLTWEYATKSISLAVAALKHPVSKLEQKKKQQPTQLLTLSPNILRGAKMEM